MLKIILCTIAFVGIAVAQNPNTPIFPGGIATDNNLLVASDNGVSSLTTSVTSVSTTIPLLSTANFIAPTALQIGSELLFCPTLSGSSYVGCTRGWQGTTAAPYASGMPVYENMIAYYHNQVAAEIKAIENALGVNYSAGGVVSRTMSYTLQASDSFVLQVFSGTSLTATLPNPPPSPTWRGVMLNANASPLTINPNGVTFTGATTSLSQYQSATVWTDGTNYYETGGGGGVYGGTLIYTTSHTIGASDVGKLVVMNCASACAVTFEATPKSTDYWGVESIGFALATVSLNSLNWNGASSVPVLNNFRTLEVSSDGIGYYGNGPLVAGSNITFTPASNGFTIASGGGGGGSGTVNSATGGYVAYYPSTGTAVSGEAFTTPGQGGTGVANTATFTMGTSNVNLATLGTGIVKNTTITGAFTDALVADVTGLFTGTCNSVTVLHGGGACGAVNLGTDVSGQTGGTNGGTGVNNGSSTITVGGNFATSGAYPVTLTVAGSTNVTLPISGTLENTAVTTLSSLSSVNGTTIPASGTLTQTIAHGTVSFTTGSISSGTCQASATTVSASGVVTTDIVTAVPNGDPTGITGYAPSTSGSLYIWAWPTNGNVNFKVCNNRTTSSTPGTLTGNWAVFR